MLGASISDDVESGRGVVRALSHLDVTTTFGVDKVTRQRRGVAMGQRMSGYEIHHGSTERAAGNDGWIHLDDVYGVEDEGTVDPRTASFLGTTLHGLFDGAHSGMMPEPLVPRRPGERGGLSLSPGPGGTAPVASPRPFACSGNSGSTKGSPATSPPAIPSCSTTSG